MHSYHKALLSIAAILFFLVLMLTVTPRNSIGLPHPQSPIITPTSALYLPLAIREGADQSTTTSIDTSALPPTPAPPDLVVRGIVEKGEFAGTITNTVYIGYPVHFFVTIENQGIGPVNSPFWSDLFIDLPGVLPADTLYPIVAQSVDWAGISFLSPGSPVVIHLTYSQGFPAATNYHACALADTLQTVDELSDANNVNCTSFSVVNPPVTETAGQ